MISLETLKKEIENNALTHNLIIYKCAKGSEFIPHQYAIAIRDLCDCEIQHITEVSELPKDTLFGESDYTDLTIFTIDTLQDIVKETSNKVWIVCNKIDTKIKKECDNYIVEVPKLEDWQIRDYITSFCECLTEIQVDELYSMYKSNLFRLENELEKIKLIGNYDQIKPQLYTDVSNYNIFDITNAIVRRDKVTLCNAYHDINLIDIEPLGLITLLLTNFRHVIDIQLARNATDETVGVSSKQFWTIKKYSCGYYSKDELVCIYKMLTDLDYEIKIGMIDTSILINYIICKILTI